MIEAYGKSDVGRIRKTNQDAYKAVSINENALYAVVCDGMGGENGGNVASQAAVDIINKEILENYNNTENKINLLTYAVIKANEGIYNLSQTTIELRGMGTTATVVLIENDGLYIAHVGDSRVYRLRGDSFDLLTVDHSLVQLLVDKGEITPEQARVHPQKNYITRAVGILPGVDVDVQKSDFEDGDVVLICSDGFSNYFSDEEIGLMIKEIRDNDVTVDYLIEKTNSKGGADNITAVIIKNRK